MTLPKSHSSRLNILLVDDSRTDAALLSQKLHHLGHEVTASGSGFEALNQLQQPENSFNLILLDVSMPGISGLDTARGSGR